MRTNEHKQIQFLSYDRQNLLAKYEESWDDTIGEFGDYAMEEPPEIDTLATRILYLIKTYRDKLPLEFILEELTKLGQAPNVIYDDNGHFAITGDGVQDVCDGDEPQELNFGFHIEKEEWFNTIREALDYYLDND